jgi:hypothetical protein
MPCQTTYSNVLTYVYGKPLDELLCAIFVDWDANRRDVVETSPAVCRDHRDRQIIVICPLTGERSIRLPRKRNRCISSVAMRLSQRWRFGIAICETHRRLEYRQIVRNPDLIVWLGKHGQEMRYFYAHIEQLLALVFSGSCSVY